MSEIYNWKGTSLILDENIDTEASMIELFGRNGIKLREDSSNQYIRVLENQNNYFILENKHISQSTSLISIIEKLAEKEYSNRSTLYSTITKSFVDIKSAPTDKENYKKVLSENIIDGDKREIDVSINVLNEILTNNKSKLVVDIFILFALAHKVSYSAEKIIIEFRADGKACIEELNLLESAPLNLWCIYDWIFNDVEYEESFYSKLEVFRQVVLNKRKILPAEDLLFDSKLAYRRIISKKTDEYFQQINRLKDDFLVLSKNQQTSVRALNLTFFAWLGALGIEIFKIVSNYDGSDLWKHLFLSSGSKQLFVIISFLIALIFIWCGYKLEVQSLQKEYEVIEKLYKDMILFDTETDELKKFSQVIEQPTVGRTQFRVFVLIVLLLLLRLIIIFRYPFNQIK